MKAIILAAGYATRLYPITLKQPKALLPINDVPIINFIIDELNEIEALSDIYVITNDLFADDFYRWKESITSAKPVIIVNDHTLSEETKLGAIGDLNFCINEHQIDEETLVIAGDSYFNFKLRDFYDFFKKIGKDSVCVEEIEDRTALQRFAVAVTDENGKILELEEKPQSPRSNCAVYAIYCYTQEAIRGVKRYLDEGNKSDAPGYFLEWLHNERDVYIYKIDGNCYDIGTLESYENVQKIPRK